MPIAYVDMAFGIDGAARRGSLVPRTDARPQAVRGVPRAKRGANGVKPWTPRGGASSSAGRPVRLGARGQWLAVPLAAGILGT